MSRAARENLARSVVEGDARGDAAAEEELRPPRREREPHVKRRRSRYEPGNSARAHDRRATQGPLRAYVVSRPPAPRLRAAAEGRLRSWDDVRVYSAPVELDEDGSRTVDALARPFVSTTSRKPRRRRRVAQGVGLSLATMPRGGAREASADHVPARRRSGSGHSSPAGARRRAVSSARRSERSSPIAGYREKTAPEVLNPPAPLARPSRRRARAALRPRERVPPAPEARAGIRENAGPLPAVMKSSTSRSAAAAPYVFARPSPSRLSASPPSPWRLETRAAASPRRR